MPPVELWPQTGGPPAPGPRPASAAEPCSALPPSPTHARGVGRPRGAAPHGYGADADAAAGCMRTDTHIHTHIISFQHTYTRYTHVANTQCQEGNVFGQHPLDCASARQVCGCLPRCAETRDETLTRRQHTHKAGGARLQHWEQAAHAPSGGCGRARTCYQRGAAQHTQPQHTVQVHGGSSSSPRSAPACGCSTSIAAAAGSPGLLLLLPLLPLVRLLLL